MQITIDNTTRFFTVVGAPYLAERHLDCGETAEPCVTTEPWQRVPSPWQACTAGWLQDDR